MLGHGEQTSASYKNRKCNNHFPGNQTKYSWWRFPIDHYYDIGTKRVPIGAAKTAVSSLHPPELTVAALILFLSPGGDRKELTCSKEEALLKLPWLLLRLLKSSFDQLLISESSWSMGRPSAVGVVSKGWSLSMGEGLAEGIGPILCRGTASSSSSDSGGFSMSAFLRLSRRMVGRRILRLLRRSESVTEVSVI